MDQQVIVPEVPAQPAVRVGPSKLGVAILIGAAALLLATWHRLTSRCGVCNTGYRAPQCVSTASKRWCMCAALGHAGRCSVSPYSFVAANLLAILYLGH